MDKAKKCEPPPQAWRDALRRARAEVAAGQTVESETIFAEIAADLDATQADESVQPDTPSAPPR
jgi:hypothetical protein